MEEGHQKSKRLSHTAKFKREVTRYAKYAEKSFAQAMIWMDPKMSLYGRMMMKIKMIVTGWRAWKTIHLCVMTANLINNKL
jgi:hypothetical protein